MKSNIEFLRDILDENLLADEAFEFLDALEKELNDQKDEIETLEGNISDLETEIKEIEDEGEKLQAVTIGALDTVYYRLENGNLMLLQKVEAFLGRLKSHYVPGSVM